MKTRIDKHLVASGQAPTIEKARAVIGAGQVLVNDICIDKIGAIIDSHAKIRLKKTSRYVSRGGLKLEKALQTFSVSITDIICVDIGASTGGFTDCLLQHGARKVYAIDVAYGQLAWKLRQDKRVVVMERCNARHLTTASVQDAIELCVIDASFISLKLLIPPLLSLLSPKKEIIALIKPQFELARDAIEKGGVVTKSSLHQQSIDEVVTFINQLSLVSEGVVESPILGPKGNREFLIHLRDSSTL